MITKLAELIKFDEKIKIVDIGANPLPYHGSALPTNRNILDTE